MKVSPRKAEEEQLLGSLQRLIWREAEARLEVRLLLRQQADVVKKLLANGCPWFRIAYRATRVTGRAMIQERERLQKRYRRWRTSPDGGER